ncbi:hypothetical protein GPJ56_003412 [Histomonas meleagridis]|uniref:uncharacterized protein n=1 Tax=Histomonas meleagridis TaxID=135588 RepID=UPI00355A3A32|nr:hypothetical protein GPJ56_003412 [Histomonas meleagridis]KAH0799103.1 hypothetical protein GO595_007900 [Histomonas meleagridis]
MKKKEQLEEITKKVKKLIDEMKSIDASTQIGYDNAELSDSDFSDYLYDISDDGLSEVSDIPSIASIYPTLPKTKNETIKTNKRKISKIPVPKGKGIPKKIQSPKQSNVRFAKPIEIQQQQVIHPINFLAPDFSKYSKATLCIFEGTGFPRSRNGERSTYIVARLHPDLPPVESPICFNRTNDATYNGGFDLNIIGLDFTSIVPVIEVFDFISETQRELIGMAFIQLNMAHNDNDICVVLQDEWIDIYTINTRMKCGKIRMSLVFHNEDDDISHLIHKNQIEKEQISKSSKQQKENKLDKDDEQLSKKESTAVQTVPETPPIQKDLFTEDSSMSEMHLDYSLPVGPWKSFPCESDSLNIPVKEIKKEKINPNKPVLYFVDEVDLDVSDELIKEEPPLKTSKPFIKPKIKDVNQYNLNLDESFSSTTDKEEKNIRETEASPLMNRYAKYSDFNWN